MKFTLTQHSNQLYIQLVKPDNKTYNPTPTMHKLGYMNHRTYWNSTLFRDKAQRLVDKLNEAITN